VSSPGAAPPPRWILGAAPDSGQVRELAAALRIPQLVCEVLAVRGRGEVEAAKAHLRPLLEHLQPPESLPDAPAASERLLRAIESKETILVHGDYDVDGISATALYTRWLRRLGGRVVPFVPHRIRDGYDFGAAGLAAARDAEASLVLTADCGTVANTTIENARAAGIDVIVTDHHTPGERLPPATVFVNPNLPDHAYPGGPLSGAGVAFKVCTCLARDAGVSFDELVPYLDLVALATVADLVPLRGENRVLVRYGLRALERTANPGLRALIDVAGLSGKAIGSGRVAFGLAPRINAMGRLGDAADALRLLLTDSPDEARALANQADETNRSRKEEDQRTLGEALELLSSDFDPAEQYGVVLAADGWHPGVIGIVASRVVERIQRPTVMIALDGPTGRGSARSIPSFDLHDAIRSCAGHLIRFGGHRQAAGMDLTRENVPAFREAFAAEARRRLGPEDLRASLKIDLETRLGALGLDTCDVLDYLAPHGIGNPRPTFLVREARVGGSPRTVGDDHLRLKLTGDGASLAAIGFGLAGRCAPWIGRGSEVDAVFHLQINEYRGRRMPEARLLDVRPTGTEPLVAEPREGA